MTIILGPCACQVCGSLLTWDGEHWLFQGTQLIHVPLTCQPPIQPVKRTSVALRRALR